MQVLTSNLFLSTRITRPDANDGEPGELDVIVYFRIESYRPGSPGKFYGGVPDLQFERQPPQSCHSVV